jgi:L-aminopeptidase/D-esterase-like protein
MLTGGSAYGLDAAAGVMQWLKQHNKGFAIGSTVVPIVPAACVFDLTYLSDQAPSKEDAYLACQIATANNQSQGRMGAGPGALVGKLVSDSTPMFGGIGVAELTGPEGLMVRAYAVVNAIGDIVDKDTIVAGAKLANGEFANSLKSISQGKVALHPVKSSIMNTTLVAVFTNAKFNKAGLIRLAKMGSGGLAQATSPSLTSLDGDTVFCFSLGELMADELITGSLIQEAVRQAIVNAAKVSNS